MDALRGDSFSPADEDDGGSLLMLCVLAALLAVGVAVGIAGVVTSASAETPQQAEPELVTVYDTPAESVEVTASRTDGPIYDLPESVSQQIVCDRLNREYLLLTTDQGGVCLVPYLDEDGDQAVMPNA